jgi:predicted AAA+ superfamily ATPase
MDRSTAEVIIRDFQSKKPEHGIPRELAIPLDLALKKSITITGPRRSGKTFFLNQTADALGAKTQRKRVLFASLDDDRLFPVALQDLDRLVKVYYEMYPELEDERCYFFFDEIQAVTGWELFIRRLLDTRNVMVFISGSSSKILGGEIATSLRGRTLGYELFPFSIFEFFAARNHAVENPAHLTSKEESRTRHLLGENLRFGGFPEVVLAERDIKEKILAEYCQTMLYRDIVERHGIRNLSAVRIFMKLMMTGYAKEFSVNKMYSFLKSQHFNIAKTSLYEYLEWFNDALAVFPLRKFSRSIKESEQSIPKLYVSDTGFTVPYSVGDVDRDIGRRMENAVFMHLKRSGYAENSGLFYYKTRNGKEVDFVQKGRQGIEALIQVCYDVSNSDTRRRESEALLEASKELGCKKCLVITWDYEEPGREISYLPLWKYLYRSRKVPKGDGRKARV